MQREAGESRVPERRTGGPGPFVTHRVQTLASDLHRVATSRRHRKGLPPHEATHPDQASLLHATHAAAFRHVLAPHRLGWWIALLFAIGSVQFLVGALATTWPERAPAALRDPQTLGAIFFVGSVFFTSAALLQWLEAVNGDVAEALEDAPRPWRWLAWRPRDLGYLACSIQLLGTILFNFNTADAMIPHLSGREQDVLVWVPDMLGSICFLAASYLAYAEVSQGAASLAPRSVSWWIAVVNLAGSVAFQLSALVSPGAGMLAVSSFLTAVGAFCFLVGAYLLVPELFDTDPG